MVTNTNILIQLLKKTTLINILVTTLIGTLINILIITPIATLINIQIIN